MNLSPALQEFVHRHGREPIIAALPRLPRTLTAEEQAEVRRQIIQLRAQNAAQT